MRRLAATVALAVSVVACCVFVPPGDALSSGYRRGARQAPTRIQLLDGLTPREGLEFDTLHVVPLVADGAGEPTAPGLAAAAARWADSERGEGLVDVLGGGPEDVQVVLAGTLLVGGGRERILDRTEPLFSSEGRGLAALVCDGRKEAVEPARRTLGPLAPIEQRKMLLLREKETSFGVLMRIQALLADAAPEVQTVAGVLSTPSFAERADKRFAAAKRIVGAYAGQTRGHVVFFGYRPMEVIVARSPAAYRAVAPAYLRSACESHVLWVEATGLQNRRGGLVEPLAYMDCTRDLIGNMKRMKLRPWKRNRAGAFLWPQSVGTVDGVRATESFVARLSADMKGQPYLVEAIENGTSIIHPLPLRGPGGPAVDDMPDISGGALTEKYLRRLLERRQQR